MHEMSETRISSVMMLDTKNIGVAVEMSLLLCRPLQAEITLFHINFRLQAAIFDILLILT